MQIVWDKTAVAELKKTHTVLELETFSVNGEMLQTWCVLPAEKIVMELPTIDSYIELHKAFVQAWKDKNYKLLEDLSEQLIGRFGGELDSFYEELIKKITNIRNESVNPS
jgi:hypothetical protein